MNDKVRQFEWGIFLLWILTSAMGWMIGFFIGVILAEIIDGIVIWSSEILFYFMLGAGLGSGVGFMQWLLLWWQIPRAGWWVLASAAGLAVASGVGIAADTLKVVGSIDTLLGWTLVGVLGGAIIGIFQWLVLRKQVSRAGWWVLASTLGWGLSMVAWEVFSADGVWSFSGLPASGATLGVVTGGFLVWLLGRSKSEG